MLQKSKSKQAHLLKYALLIPLVFGMLIYTSCIKKENNVLVEEESIEGLISRLKIKVEKGQLSNEEVKVLNQFSGSILFKRLDLSNSEKFFLEGSNSPEKNQIPFSIIEQPPIFQECKELELMYQKKCMAKKISVHVKQNFNTNIANTLNLKGKQKINVIFKIDKTGNVTDIRSRASHPSLEEEAIRAVKTLPKMIPGEHKGEKVIVKYSLPIVFQVAD